MAVRAFKNQTLKPHSADNQRAMHDLIFRHKQGLEAAIRTMTGLWHINVVFEGTRAYTKDNTIVLPNVDTWAAHDRLTEEDLEAARAYFLALRGFAWQQAAVHVESDRNAREAFRRKMGSFAFAVESVLDDIRTEHIFSKRGPGIAETIEYTRESWIWPRFARKKAKEGRKNLLFEAMYGLQVTLKHYEARKDHVLWQALEPEACSFVERNLDALDSAYDTLKMDKEKGTARLCEVVEHMFQTWKTEFDLVAPLAKRKEPAVVSEPLEALRQQRVSMHQKMMQYSRYSDEFDAAREDLKTLDDQIKAMDPNDDGAIDNALDNMITAAFVPPVLLVTYGPSVRTLNSVPFAGGYVRRVEWMPKDEEGWQNLTPLTDDETRTMVLHPPDPEAERALDDMMGNLIRSVMQIQQGLQEEAKQKMEEAKQEIERLPADQKPYLVYTSKHDRFRTTPDGELHQLKHLRERVMQYYGMIMRRLKVLLRTQTQTRWRGNQLTGARLDMRRLTDIANSHRMPNVQLRPFVKPDVEDELLETVVGLLTDVSGSMTWGNGPFGSKLDLARAATLGFAEALHMAGIPFAAWAFTSNDRPYVWQQSYYALSEQERDLYGRFGGLDIETIKDFDEAWPKVATRLPRMGEHNEANYDADSVKWAAQQLLRRRAKRRVLLVLSDGLPATSEPSIQVARQQAYLAEVVKAMIAIGVEVVGIGICDDSVEDYYPHHTVIHRADDLPKVVMNEMESLLLAARRQARR